MTMTNVINTASKIANTAKAVKFGMSFMPMEYHISGLIQTLIMGIYIYLIWNFEGWVAPFVCWYVISTLHGWWIGANNVGSKGLWMSSVIIQSCVLVYLVYFIFG